MLFENKKCGENDIFVITNQILSTDNILYILKIQGFKVKFVLAFSFSFLIKTEFTMFY